MEAILDGLNPAQRTAVTSPASILQVLAPPGSGKTKTLTARAAYLLQYHRYQPEDVICCTFTIKASREMRQRISRLIGDRLESRLILGTFHSICRRYLVAYGHLIGLKKGFGIADSSDSLAIIRRIIKRLKLGIQPNTARSRISGQKARGISYEELVAAKYPKKVEQQEFIQVYKAYELALSSSNLLDYDDLLLKCADLLRRHPQCASNVQAVLVDEFQDTNRIQFDLMNLFAAQHRRITIVGDPDQSIYGFRSADIENLTCMQRQYKETSVVLLEYNYRSSGSILVSAEKVIEQDASRQAKRLHATHSVGTLPVLRKLPTAAVEARWLVMEIKRCISLTGGLLNHSDFAVLLRSTSLSRQIESEMAKEGIPYRVVGSFRFFDRIEVKLLLDYLRVVNHPEDSDTLIRILNVPSRKVGDETIKLLMAGAEEANVPLWTYIKDVVQGLRSTRKTLSKTADQGLGTFLGLVQSCRQKLLECHDGSAPRKLLEFIIKRLSFKDFLKRAYPLDEESRWANVEELLAQAEDASSSRPGFQQDDRLPELEGLEQQQQGHPGQEALSRFLANVALSTEVISNEGTQEKVIISTIHAAKGLEWPVVFVPAVYEGIIPHSRAEDSDEERRLLYVAMTRAQALLYLSYPRQDSKYNDETTPSSFLPQKLVETRFRPTGPVFHEKAVGEIANILCRKRPGYEELLKGMGGLPSIEDNLWTADGTENSTVATTWDPSIFMQPVDGLPRPKRRRCEQDNARTSMWSESSTYTMNNHASLSISNTISHGFLTARQHLAAQKMTVGGHTLEKKPSALQTGSTLSRNSDRLTQGTLSSFFGQPRSKKQAPRSPPPSMNPQPHEVLRDSQDGGINLPQASRGIPRLTVPEGFLDHRVQPQHSLPSRPILKVSDPNKYTWLSALSHAVESSPSIASKQNSGNISVKKQTETRAESDEIKRPSSCINSVQPAATYHTTTMSIIHQTGSTTGRKTLGIRRSINGWAEQMNKASNRNP